jgi:hypothetical protein
VNTVGFYSIPGLSPGVYRVIFSAYGYQDLKRDEIQVVAGDILTLDVILYLKGITMPKLIVKPLPPPRGPLSRITMPISGDVLINMGRDPLAGTKLKVASYRAKW